MATSLWQSLTTTLEGERADKDEHNPRALRTNTNTQNIRNPYATATACSGISAAVYNDFDDVSPLNDCVCVFVCFVIWGGGGEVTDNPAMLID